VGSEVYNVDAYEFDDLSAHSQIPDGKSACDAGNDSVYRESWLGAEIRSGLANVAISPSEEGAAQVAVALGRALHTIQDNCAHHGMPNPQHAWHSLSDSCFGTSESPDLVPAAFNCAAAETDAVFAAFHGTVDEYGVGYADLDRADSAYTHWPSHGDVCAFLGSAGGWDGVDRRWNNAVMSPALRDQLVRSITSDDAGLTDVCANGSIEALTSDPELDTSGGAMSCLKIHAFCLGKADSADEAPPWETEPAMDAPPSGCSVGGRAPLGAPALLALALAALLVRRRRRA
jgi:MYXO-CTERM domain-containing protein